MAEYQEVVKQFKRMCKSYNTSCDSCPVKEHREIFHCWRWISEEPELAEGLIMKWAREHPPVTNRDKFLEVFGFDFFTKPLVGGPCYIWANQEYKEPKDDRP